MTEREDGRGEGREPLDEEAAWKQIVDAYGEEPAVPPEARPAEGGRDGDDGGEQPVRSFTVYAAGAGPRDWQPAEPSDGDLDENDEGHFVPPEPPPLPRGDTVTRFAWTAALGGPLLLLSAVLLQQELTWWVATLGVGGFLGGFVTLVTRLRDGREDDGFDDPGRGAVV